MVVFLRRWRSGWRRGWRSNVYPLKKRGKKIERERRRWNGTYSFVLSDANEKPDFRFSVAGLGSASCSSSRVMDCEGAGFFLCVDFVSVDFGVCVLDFGVSFLVGLGRIQPFLVAGPRAVGWVGMGGGGLCG